MKSYFLNSFVVTLLRNNKIFNLLTLIPTW